MRISKLAPFRAAKRRGRCVCWRSRWSGLPGASLVLRAFVLEMVHWTISFARRANRASPCSHRKIFRALRLESEGVEFLPKTLGDADGSAGIAGAWLGWRGAAGRRGCADRAGLPARRFARIHCLVAVHAAR